MGRMPMTGVRDDKLGIWMTGALVVGSMIGSGIFMLPVSLAPLGANTLIGWLVSIVGALAIAFALACLGRTGAGGIHAYIERAFGPTAAFSASVVLRVRLSAGRSVCNSASATG